MSVSCFTCSAVGSLATRGRRRAESQELHKDQNTHTTLPSNIAETCVSSISVLKHRLTMQSMGLGGESMHLSARYPYWENRGQDKT